MTIVAKDEMLHIRPLPRDEDLERDVAPITVARAAVDEFATGLASAWREHGHVEVVRLGVKEGLEQMHRLIGDSREPHKVWAEFGVGEYPFA